MSLYTAFLNLFKKDPVADKDDTFSISTMLNDNGDKIDAGVSDISQKQKASLKFPTATGSANSIVVNTGTFELVDGQSFTFIPSANNNGAATTINADSKGVIPLYKPATTTAPKLVAGKPLTVWYDLSGNSFFIKASAEGNATAAHVLAPYTFSSDDDVGVVGTIPVKTGQYGALGASIGGGYINVDVPGSGYYPDDSILTIYDADYVASNVKKDANLWGLVGTLVENPLVGINPNYAFVTGYELTYIDKNYRYMSQGGQSSPLHARYNHSGTLIDSIRPSDPSLPAHYWANVYTDEFMAFNYGPNVRIYDAAGTLIRVLTLSYQSDYNTKQNFCFNGTRIILQEDGVETNIRYFNELGTYLGVRTVPIGYDTYLMLNPNKTIVTKANFGNQAAYYCKQNDVPNAITNLVLYDYLRMSL